MTLAAPSSPPRGRPVTSLADALSLPGSGWVLQLALTARFTTDDGRTVEQNAAAELGVTPTTIKGWTTNSLLRSTVGPRHLPALLTALTPTPNTLRREQLELTHAHEGLHRLSQGPTTGNWAQWTNTHWLEPHRVLLLAPARGGLRRLGISLDTPTTITRLVRGYTVHDQTTVDTRFAATVLRQYVLEHVRAWRIETGPGQVSRGHTQTWLEPATLPNLTAIAERLSSTTFPPST